MINTNKNIIAIILFLVIPGFLFAQAKEITDKGFQIYLSSDLDALGANRPVKIIGYYGKDTEIAIPYTVIYAKTENCPVVRIDNGAFQNKRLTAITGSPQFPASLVEIGENAFADNMLTRITIPGKIAEVSAGAFRNNKLTSLTIESGVKFIGNEAFRGNMLSTLSLPSSVTYVGENAFTGNPLTTIEIGSNVDVENSAFPYNFAAYYKEKGKKSGTYVYKENQWYSKQEWDRIVAARNAAQQEKQAPTPPPREPDYQIGLILEDKADFWKENINNWIKLYPWYSLKLGEDALLNISGIITFQWNQYSEWLDPFIELGHTSLEFYWSDNRAEIGRVYYDDPLGYIATGLFDGIKFSFFSSTLQLGGFYSGFINKKSANIIMSIEDIDDYNDVTNSFAPKRLIGSFHWRIGDYNTHLMLGALAQLDMRKDYSPLNSQYLMAKFHFGDGDFDIDLGTAVSFLQEGEDPNKLGAAASIDLSWWFYDSSLSIGLWWFSGAIDENINYPFKPITNYRWNWFISAYQPSLFLPRITFAKRINDIISFEISALYYIWEGEEYSENSEFKIEATASIKTPSFPTSSSSKNTNLDLDIPLFFGLYTHALDINTMGSRAALSESLAWFLGMSLQIGPEIEIGDIISLDLLGEVGAGTCFFANYEYNVGGMAELYFMKLFGLGFGFGIYGNMAMLLDNDDIILTYTRFELLFRIDETYKLGLFFQKFSNDMIGFGLRFSMCYGYLH